MTVGNSSMKRDWEPPRVSGEEVAAWFAGRLPEGWFTSAPAVSIDREEVVVVGELPGLQDQQRDAAATAAAESGRISRFREETRDERMEIARQAEHRFGRKVAWAARVGGTEESFTSLAAPVMSRLRQPERKVLDTLVAAGVARSRSDALAWAVRLVGRHAESWLAELRTAMSAVDDLRAEGPDLK
jgi:Arc/MetJ-type ribon-helix-helix transcriptional regulator